MTAPLNLSPGNTLDRRTGKVLSGWDSVVQSLQVAYSTRKATRVLRREVGTNGPALVDQPINRVTLIDAYAAIAEASRLEPRFRMTRVTTFAAANSGDLTFLIQGIYFPRGHLGDFSVQEPKKSTITF